jgi:hypothetical protein
MYICIWGSNPQGAQEDRLITTINNAVPPKKNSSQDHMRAFGAKNIKKQKNKVACNPDLGRAVVLSVPRSASLAYFQPAGASRRPDASRSKKEGGIYIY